MTKKRKEKHSDYYLILLAVTISKMHDKEDFCFHKIRRKIQPYCKTILRPHSLGLTLRGIDGDTAIFYHDPLSGYVRIISTNRYRHIPDFNMEWLVTSNKHFLQKVLKHGLLTKIP